MTTTEHPGGPAAPEGYPPTRHMLRDLGIAVEFGGRERCAARLPVTPGACNPGGGVSTGVVAALVDVLGGTLAVTAVFPDWIATADLSVFLSGQARQGTVLATGALLRAGRTRAVVEVDIFEASGGGGERSRPIGYGLMTFSRLSGRDGTPQIDVGEAPHGTVEFALPGSGLQSSLADEAGIREPDPAGGVVELPFSDYVRNSLGALQGGMVALLAARAGELAGQVAPCRNVAVRDIEIHYLAPGKRGPFRTRARVLRAGEADALCRVEVLDTGAGDRLMAVALTAAVLP